MNGESYTTTFRTERSADAVFDAINDVRGWWGEDIEGANDAVGDEFTFRVGDVHYTKLEVVERRPGEKVAWLVLDNHIGYITDQTEWVGTTISFEISRDGDETAVCFTHLGLVAAYECYDSCSDAWGHLIGKSLPSLIETGTGYPFGRVARGEEAAV